MVRFVEADDNATFLEDLLDEEEKDEEDNSEARPPKKGTRLLNRGNSMPKDTVTVRASCDPSCGHPSFNAVLEPIG